MSPTKIEAVALASMVSVAFGILLSTTTLIFNNVPAVLFVWGAIVGVILGHQEVKRIGLCYGLSVIPALVLCLGPAVMAALRALLASAANVVPDVQNFLGYSIFNPAWWQVSPLKVVAVIAASFVVSSLLLAICTLAGGQVLTLTAQLYAAGPTAFDRIETIIKRVLTLGSLIGVYIFTR